MENKEQLIGFRVYGKVATSAQTDGRIKSDGSLHTGTLLCYVNKNKAAQRKDKDGLLIEFGFEDPFETIALPKRIKFN